MNEKHYLTVNLSTNNYILINTFHEITWKDTKKSYSSSNTSLSVSMMKPPNKRVHFFEQNHFPRVTS